MKQFDLRLQGGQILIEAVVALSIVMIGLVGIFGLLSRSLGLNRVLMEQYTAAYLAAEGIEVIKNIIDTAALQKKAWGLATPAGIYQIDFQDTSLTGKNISGANPETNCQAAYAEANADNLALDPASGIHGYNLAKTMPYKRIICVRSEENGNKLKVNSVVTWQGKSGQQNVNLEDHFYNWR